MEESHAHPLRRTELKNSDWFSINAWLTEAWPANIGQGSLLVLQPMNLFRLWLDFSLCTLCKSSLPQALKLQFFCHSQINSVSGHLSLPQLTSLLRLLAIIGNIPFRRDHSFRWTWKQGLSNATEWVTYFHWHADASKRFLDSIVASLRVIAKG